MRNPTKFGSLNLDNPSSRYEFLKLVFKSMKINKKFKATLRLTDGVRGQRDPPVSKPEQRQHLTGDSSPTARSPAVASSRLHSLCSPAPSGAPRWTGGALEHPRRRQWRTADAARQYIDILWPWYAQMRCVTASR